MNREIIFGQPHLPPTITAVMGCDFMEVPVSQLNSWLGRGYVLRSYREQLFLIDPFDPNQQ